MAPQVVTWPLVHLERLGSLDEEVVKFYVAQLSSAVQFLHENNIMHRSVYLGLLLTPLLIRFQRLEARQYPSRRAGERPSYGFQHRSQILREETNGCCWVNGLHGA